MTDKTEGLEVVANYDEVICPKCVHQFRAIPVNVQDRIIQLEAALVVANSNHEEFERKWYLETDRTEKLEAALRVAHTALCKKRPPADHPKEWNPELHEAIAAIDALGVTK